MLLGADILLAIICTLCVFGKEWQKGKRSRKKPGKILTKQDRKAKGTRKCVSSSP